MQKSCLSCIYKHLIPEGILVFDVYNCYLPRLYDEKYLKEVEDIPQVVLDDVEAIGEIIHKIINDGVAQVILLTGGTGISSKDVTIEAVSPLFTKELSAFGPLFAKLSMEEIDSAAIMSRAIAGLIGNTIVFCMPGSLNACKLACTRLIFPELGHLVKHAND